MTPYSCNETVVSSWTPRNIIVEIPIATPHLVLWHFIVKLGIIMPVIDCENYSLHALKGAMEALDDEIRESGGDPVHQPRSFVNIYFAVQHLRAEDDQPWWICVPRRDRFLVILLHRVRHGDVVQTTVPEIADTLGLCITLLWTSKGDLVSEYEDAIQQARDFVTKFEVRFGQPLPLPLTKLQMPDRFAIMTIDPSAGENNPISMDICMREANSCIEISPEMAVELISLLEASNSEDEVFNSRIKRALYISARWQARALRAIGREEWSDVVIASNIFIETLLVSLTTIMNEQDGNEINLEEGRGWVKFVITNLGRKYLYGPWDQTKEDTIFGRWHKKCYKVRNAIVHKGHFATKAQANEAYLAANKLAIDVTMRAHNIDNDKFSEILQGLPPSSAFSTFTIS